MPMAMPTSLPPVLRWLPTAVEGVSRVEFDGIVEPCQMLSIKGWPYSVQAVWEKGGRTWMRLCAMPAGEVVGSDRGALIAFRAAQAWFGRSEAQRLAIDVAARALKSPRSFADLLIEAITSRIGADREKAIQNIERCVAASPRTWPVSNAGGIAQTFQVYPRLQPRKRRRRSLRGLSMKRAFLGERTPDPADAGVHRAIAAMQRPTKANEL